jgi:hypothetical protein
MCNLADFTLGERDSLKLLFDNGNIRLIIGICNFRSIQQIESLIKHFALILTEFRKIAKKSEINDNVEELLNRIESDPIMKEKIQIVYKELFLRVKGARIATKDELRAIHGILLILDKSCSKTLIEKLSTLPVLPLIESATSVATASFIKCKI